MKAKADKPLKTVTTNRYDAGRIRTGLGADAIDLVASGFFSNGDRELFRPLVDSLLNRDDYMLLADYQSYVGCQQRVSEAYRDQKIWTRMSILNSARVGRFSSDRSIREYCRDMWNVSPITTEGKK